MRYGTFLKERGYIAAIFGWLFFSIETFLLTFRDAFWLMLYVAVMLWGGFFLLTFLEYRREKKFLIETMEISEKLEEPYLIGEMEIPALTKEQKLWKEFLQTLGKSMKEHVNEYRKETKEYKEYIELWIHEVKLPIAAAKLMINNHRLQVPEGLEREIDRIESYTEQALFYARSNDVEKDYFIREIPLSDIVNETVSLNRRELLSMQINLSLHDLDLKVYTDAKWMIFILNQILSNSLKYMDDVAPCIEIYGEKSEESTSLWIQDNGIGIKEEEVSRVFEKGFTGSNGRLKKKSTGIGLYLCRKLCNRLGASVDLQSGENQGCTVRITFPRSSYVEEIK